MAQSSEAYKLFRSWVALQKVPVDSSDKVWKYFDFGPKDVEPLVFIPGASGTAEVFYKQFVSLCPRGYRLISVQYPEYATHEAWCQAFDLFLDRLELPKVHLFGTSLGGYMALCFAQYKPSRVKSIVLNNAFADNQHYKDSTPFPSMFRWMPLFMLQRSVLSNFPTGELEDSIRDSVDFMVEQLESLSQAELSSRLILNCTLGNLRPTEIPLDHKSITIMDTWDEVAVPERLRDEVYKLFPDAKVATLKTGGNFPYLSRPDEVNMFLQVHLRNNGVVPNVGGKEEQKSTQ